MKITRIITVDTPPAAVYAYLKDFTTSEAWDPGTVETTLVDGEGEVGSTYHNRSVFRGKETELTYVVTDLEPERLVALRGENKTVITRDIMKMRPAPGGTGTEVTYEAEFTFKGIAALAAPFLRGQLTKLGDEAEETIHRELSTL